MCVCVIVFKGVYRKFKIVDLVVQGFLYVVMGCIIIFNFYVFVFYLENVLIRVQNGVYVELIVYFLYMRRGEFWLIIQLNFLFKSLDVNSLNWIFFSILKMIKGYYLLYILLFIFEYFRGVFFEGCFFSEEGFFFIKNIFDN